MPFDSRPEPPAESETIRILVGAREWLSDEKNWCRALRHSERGQSCVLGAIERQLNIGDRPFDVRCVESLLPEAVETLHRFVRPTSRDGEVDFLVTPMGRKAWRIAMNNDAYGYEHTLDMLDKAIAYLRKREMLNRVKEMAHAV